MFYNYPKDPNTYPIDLQFFYGKSIMVAPVTDQDSTSVSVYFPKDIFYDFKTLAQVRGAGKRVTLTNIGFTEIPLYIRGGTVLPLRVAGAMTTTALRQTDFEFVVAPDLNGKASGELYMDDGESITPSQSTRVTMTFADGSLAVKGVYGYPTGVNIARVKFLGVASVPSKVLLNGREVTGASWTYNGGMKVLSVAVGSPFTGTLAVRFLL
jgi:alpha-glucosidase